MTDLSVTLTDLRNEATQILYDTVYSDIDLTSAQTGRVDKAVLDGERRFFTPIFRDAAGRPRTHIWSFLYNKTTLRVFPLQTGTHTTDPATGILLTDTAADFLHGYGLNGADLIGEVITTTSASTGTTYTNTITAVTSKTSLTTTGNAFDAAIASGDTYVIGGFDGDYQLSDDFGGIDGPLTFDATTGYPPIEIVSEGYIRELRQNNYFSQTERPSKAAIRSRSSNVSSTTQKFELMLWPKPNAYFLLHLNFVALISALSTGTDVAYGGALHAQTILAAVRSSAEDMLDPSSSTKVYDRRFRDMLVASIAIDQSLTTADSVGISTDTGIDRTNYGHNHYLNAVSYKGVQYPT